MISLKNSFIYLMLLTFGLSSVSSTPTCSISAPFVGQWIQPGLVDVITINETWYSSKGTCLDTLSDVTTKTKFIFYNEQTRCKRCVFFISRHENILQYRESECFDADDDDNGRICGSITPDTVLYTLFRDNAQSISCPFEQSWNFEQNRFHQSICHPKSFDFCSSNDRFQLSFNRRCSTNRDLRAICLARFTDGNVNYVVARSEDRSRFICFSYAKMKRDETDLPPSEVYLSTDETCRDFLSRESALSLNVVPGPHYRSEQTNINLPEWAQGKWSTIASTNANSQTFQLNRTHLSISKNHDLDSTQTFKLTRVVFPKRNHHNTLRIEAKLFDQCSTVTYCIKVHYRSASVIDFSMGTGEQACKNAQTHYTLYKATSITAIDCPKMGQYKSSKSYRPSIALSTCSIGVWTMSIGCESKNHSELSLSSSCQHELVTDVQVITSIRGVCVGSWRTNDRFQRTLVVYEGSRAFCLIQPLNSSIASWISTESSCTEFDPSIITVDNSLRFSETCQNWKKISRFSSENFSTIRRSESNLLFATLFVLVFCKY